MEYTEIEELEQIVAQSRNNHVFKAKLLYSPRLKKKSQVDMANIEELIEESTPTFNSK